MNAEDHLCVIVTSLDVKGVFARYAGVMTGLETLLRQQNNTYFSSDDLFGYHTCNPRNLGTAMVATMKMKLPFLYKKNPLPIIERLGLEMISNPTEAAMNGLADITFKYRLGFSEAEQMQILLDGVHLLVSMEVCLEKDDVTGCSDIIRHLPSAFVGPSILPDSISIRSNMGPISKINSELLEKDDCPIFGPEYTNCLSRHLNPTMFIDLCKKTSAADGWSIDLATRSGVQCPHTAVGVVLGGESR